MDEPSNRLGQEAKKAGLREGAFVALRHGATLITAAGVARNAPPLLPVGP